jgi:hypothetical protein
MSIKNHTVKLGEIDRGHISKTQGCDINTSDLTTVPVSLVYILNFILIGYNLMLIYVINDQQLKWCVTFDGHCRYSDSKEIT